jgi:putative zinc finger protein
MTDTTMTCDRFDALLSSYLEGELAGDTRSAVEKHASGCLRCAALVHDVRNIERRAAALPELTPSRDLWDGVAARIEAPVIKLDAGQRGTDEGTRVAGRRFTRLAIAAAILVAVTAGLTYTITVNRVDGAKAPLMARSTAPGGAESSVPKPDSPALGAQRSALAVSATRHQDVPAAVTYDREIGTLKSVLELRRNDLDPGTVAVVENSLNTIDRAIADARAALAHDSASTFLLNQLNNALEKKLGLLRAVALLPPRA